MYELGVVYRNIVRADRDVTDPDQGITHVISPELGIVPPGVTLVAPDSHTCTQGALGALAWVIGYVGSVVRGDLRWC